MKRILLIAAGLVLVTSSVAGQRYSYSGRRGPANWGSLSTAYLACDTGRAQSPIDLPLPPLTTSTDSVAVSYRVPTTGRMFNDGHTVQVDVDSGSFITLNGRRYDLVQFHFHHPAEHTLANLPVAPVEVHFVHRDSTGRLAVVAIFFKTAAPSNTAATGANYRTLLDSLPHRQGDTVSVTLNFSTTFFVTTLRTLGFRVYSGSLTTPPCTEGVTWVVSERVPALPASQIGQIEAAFSTNARPVQPLGTRTVTRKAPQTSPD